MLAICDVNEYRKCVKELGVADVEQLFDVLHSLCNLLVVVPENLRQVSSGELLVSCALFLIQVEFCSDPGFSTHTVPLSF